MSGEGSPADVEAAVAPETILDRWLAETWEQEEERDTDAVSDLASLVAAALASLAWGNYVFSSTIHEKSEHERDPILA